MAVHEPTAGRKVMLSARDHIDSLVACLKSLPPADILRAEHWGIDLAGSLLAGGKLLTAGNGGSSTEAARIALRVCLGEGRDELPLQATALSADPFAVSEIARRSGYPDVFVPQVRAAARPGVTLLVYSTSGTSPNAVNAVRAAQTGGATSYAMTGPLLSSSPGKTHLADVLGSKRVITVASSYTGSIQETHMVLGDIMLTSMERELVRLRPNMASAHPTSVALGGQGRVDAAIAALSSLSDEDVRLVHRWGREAGAAALNGSCIHDAGTGIGLTISNHGTGERTGRLVNDRRPFPAVSWGMDSCAFSAIANDNGLDQALARQADALVRPGDVVVLTSLESGDVTMLPAASAARARGARVLGITCAVAADEAALAAHVDECLVLPTSDRSIANLLALVATHLFCEGFETVADAAYQPAVARNRPPRPALEAGPSTSHPIGPPSMSPRSPASHGSSSGPSSTRSSQDCLEL